MLAVMLDIECQNNGVQLPKQKIAGMCAGMTSCQAHPFDENCIRTCKLTEDLTCTSWPSWPDAFTPKLTTCPVSDSTKLP